MAFPPVVELSGHAPLPVTAPPVIHSSAITQSRKAPNDQCSVLCVFPSKLWPPRTHHTGPLIDLLKPTLAPRKKYTPSAREGSSARDVADQKKVAWTFWKGWPSGSFT